MKTYYVYILTNVGKNVLYIGVTNDLTRRLREHRTNHDSINAFTYKYNCYYLVYYEEFNNIDQAVEREKQLKGLKRFKKEDLINKFNPGWIFLNNDV